MTPASRFLLPAPCARSPPNSPRYLRVGRPGLHRDSRRTRIGTAAPVAHRGQDPTNRPGGATRQTRRHANHLELAFAPVWEPNRIHAQPNYPPLVHDLAVDPSRHVRTQTASTVTVPHPSPSSGPWTSSASPPTTTVISSGRIQARAASQASSSVTLRIRSR